MEDLLLQTLNGTNIQINTASIIRIIIILILTAAAFIALTLIHKKLRSRLDIKNELRKAQIYRISLRVMRVIVIIAGLTAIMDAVGINLTGLSAILGIVVILLVLAVKDALQDIFAGFVIMSDKYFSVGDAVEYEGKDGIVISFTARSTKIELLDDHSVLSVANRNITRIRKLTHLVDIDLPLSYELSRKEAFSVLSNICLKISAIDGVESCELKGTQEFGENAVIYKIRFFCDPKDRPDIRREALKTVQDGLAAAGLHIPYQQIDIHEK